MKTLKLFFIVFSIYNLIILTNIFAQKLSNGLGYHNIVLRSDGTLYSWGYNYSGQLGNLQSGNSTNSNVPVAVNDVFNGKKIISIANGENHTLVLTSDSLVYAWGNNFYGQLGNSTFVNSNMPILINYGALAGKKIVAIAAGSFHSLALANDGTIYAWGSNNYGQLGNGNNTLSNIPVAVNQTGVLIGKKIIAISAGSVHSLALANDGSIYSWGNNYYGQLGNGNNTNSNIPVAVSKTGVLNGKVIKSISAGAYHSLALGTDGAIYSWGYNYYGQLGNNNNNDSNIPVIVYKNGALSGKTITLIDTKCYHNIALSSDGSIFSWGWNDYGQLGNSTYTSSNVPVSIPKTGVLSGKSIIGISVGYYHSLLLASDGTIFSWGWNDYGQLGNNNFTNSNVPISIYQSGVLSGKKPVKIYSGYYISSTITDEGKCYTWGYNYYGELGNGFSGESYNKFTPISVSQSNLNGKSLKTISTGSYHSLILTNDGLIFTFGDNTYGQLGTGSSGALAFSSMPVQVNNSIFNGKSIVTVAGGEYHSIALANDGTLYSWGNNYYGQLGNGTNTNSSIPVTVSTSGILNGKKIVAIAAGEYHNLALSSDGLVYAWGNNYYGQLGNGTNTNSNIPVAVSTSGVLNGKKIVAIAAGSYHSLALASDGTLYAWGYNYNGELGNGTNTNSNIPVAVNMTGVLNGKKIVSITSGGYHNLVLADDNKLYSWGNNYYGQLGNGGNVNSNLPVAVNDASDLFSNTIYSISAGLYHSVVLTSNGKLYSWGDNSFSQLGTGLNLNQLLYSNLPVQVNQNDIGLLRNESTVSANIDNYEIFYNYPNPFNASTKIVFNLKNDAYTTLKVYNSLGAEVATLFEGIAKKGYNYFDFNSFNFSSGIYYCKLSCNNTIKIQKMILLK